MVGPIPSASISFVAAPRPDAATRVRLDEFEGPLALLLALIEQRQLDVRTVPLGALAGAYLGALARLEGPVLPYLSTFVAVAAQLILIKSRALLPAGPGEAVAALGDDGVDPEEDLRARLVLYRTYRDAGERLAPLLDVRRMFRREPGVALAAGLAGARPADGSALDPADLARALERIVAIAPLPVEQGAMQRRSVTLEERAAAIRAALATAPIVVLQDLLGERPDRTVAAVTFLAMLELVKVQEIVIEQDEPWGPIRCRARRATGTGEGSDRGPRRSGRAAPMESAMVERSGE
jgi:segregation and condensation protein A